MPNSYIIFLVDIFFVCGIMLLAAFFIGCLHLKSGHISIAISSSIGRALWLKLLDVGGSSPPLVAILMC